MKKILLAATSLLAFAAAGAYADDPSTPAPTDSGPVTIAPVAPDSGAMATPSTTNSGSGMMAPSSTDSGSMMAPSTGDTTTPPTAPMSDPAKD